MAGLLDIAQTHETIVVDATPVDVYGVSASGIAALLSRFPQIADLLRGKAIEIDDLMALGGDIVAAIIAAGCGYPGHPAAEEKAGRMVIGTQIAFLEAILRQTLPGGFGPLQQRLESLGQVLNLSPAATPASAVSAAAA